MAGKKDDAQVEVGGGGKLERALVNILDNASRLQGPAVDKYVAHVRRAHPYDTPRRSSNGWRSGFCSR